LRADYFAIIGFFGAFFAVFFAFFAIDLSLHTFIALARSAYGVQSPLEIFLYGYGRQVSRKFRDSEKFSRIIWLER
jgi:hypothetical protein